MDRSAEGRNRAQVVLAVLAVIAALSLLKAILIPVAVALVLSCMLSPLARLVRRHLPYGPLGALRLLAAVGCRRAVPGEPDGRGPGPGDLHVALRHRAPRRPGERTNHRAGPRPAVSCAPFLPEPGTIDRLGDTNRALLIDKLSYGLTDFTTWVAQGFIVLVLVHLHADRERDADGQGGPVLRPDTGPRPESAGAVLLDQSRGRSAPT